jgi:very-short-patch-repair endonuclease
VLLVGGGQQQAVLGRWGRETVVMEDEGWEILKFWGRRVFRNEGNMRFFFKKNK